MKYSFCFQLLEEIVKNWYNSFLKCSEFFLKNSPVNLSVPGTFYSYCILIFCAFWKIVSFHKLVHFTQVIKFVCMKSFTVFLCYSFNVHGSSHDVAYFISDISNLHTLSPQRRKWQPTPVFLLENPMDTGVWQLQSIGHKETAMTAHT